MAKGKRYFVFFDNLVTAIKDGIMSAADKRKLDGIDDNANNYSHPATAGNKHIPAGGSAGKILRWSSDGTAAWGDDNNTTYSAATQSAAGLLSAADKKKLDGIDDNAKKITVDTVLSKTSDNPVQNKVIATEIESLKKSAGDGKIIVANAVTEMGVQTATDASFATIAANIKKIFTGIDTSDATAMASQILKGATAYVQGEKIIGTMENRGALNWSGSNMVYSVPAGYYSGGTLDSRESYSAGYTAGQNAAKAKDVLGILTSVTSDGSRAATFPSATINLGFKPDILVFNSDCGVFLFYDLNLGYGQYTGYSRVIGIDSGDTSLKIIDAQGLSNLTINPAGFSTGSIYVYGFGQQAATHYINYRAIKYT